MRIHHIEAVLMHRVGLEDGCILVRVNGYTKLYLEREEANALGERLIDLARREKARKAKAVEQQQGTCVSDEVRK